VSEREWEGAGVRGSECSGNEGRDSVCACECVEEGEEIWRIGRDGGRGAKERDNKNKERDERGCSREEYWGNRLGTTAGGGGGGDWE
jgi:hypothetical protein